MPPTQAELQGVIDIDLEIASKTIIRDEKIQELNTLYQNRALYHQSIIDSFEPGKIYIVTSSVDSLQYAIYNNNNAPMSYLVENIT